MLFGGGGTRAPPREGYVETGGGRRVGDRPANAGRSSPQAHVMVVKTFKTVLLKTGVQTTAAICDMWFVGKAAKEMNFSWVDVNDYMYP